MDEAKRQQLLQAAAGLLSSDDDASDERQEREDPHALIASSDDDERERRHRRRERPHRERRREDEDGERPRRHRSRSRERERGRDREHKRHRRRSRRRSSSSSSPPPAAAPPPPPPPPAPTAPPPRPQRPRRTPAEAELWVLGQTREWSARVRGERAGDERAWLGYAEWQETAAAALLSAQQQWHQQQKRRRKAGRLQQQRRTAAAVASTAAAVADKRLSVLAAGLERCPWSGRLLLASLGAYADASRGGDGGEEAGGACDGNETNDTTTTGVFARWEQALARRAVEAQARDGFGPHLARPGADGTALRREWRRWAPASASAASSSSSELSPCDDPFVSSAWPLWRAYLALRRRAGDLSPAASRALHGRAIAALAAERRWRERDARRHRQTMMQQQQLQQQDASASPLLCPAADAAARAAERLDEQLAQLVLSLARDELDAGCGEAALLRLQGAIEFCFFRPAEFASSSGFSEAALADFGDYWRSGAPRVGEAGGTGGWAAWRRQQQQPAAAPAVAAAVTAAPAAQPEQEEEEEQEPPVPAAGAGGWTGWWPAQALDETLSPPPPPPPEEEEEQGAPPPPPPPPPDEEEEEDDQEEEEDEMELVLEMGVKMEEALEEARRSGLAPEHALELARRERVADARALLPPFLAADANAADADEDDEDERAAVLPPAPENSLGLLLPTLRASPRTARGARRLLLGALELLGLGPELAAAAPSEAGVVVVAADLSWTPSNAPAPACAGGTERGRPQQARPWFLRCSGGDGGDNDNSEQEDARWLFLARLLSALCASPSAGSPCADSTSWPELGFALVHLHFRRPSLLRAQGPVAAAEAGRAAARALLSGRRDDHLLFAAFASAEARAAAEADEAAAASTSGAPRSKTARRVLEQTLAAVCGRGPAVGVAAAVALQYADAMRAVDRDRLTAASALTCALANLPFDPRAAAAAAKEGRPHPEAAAAAAADNANPPLARARRALDACLEGIARRGVVSGDDEAVIAASAALEEMLLPGGPAAACAAVFERAAAAALSPEARAACARCERLAVRHAQVAWRCGGGAHSASTLTASLLELYPCNPRLWRLLTPLPPALAAAATKRLPGRADLWLMRGRDLPRAEEQKALLLERALRACRGGAADRLALAVFGEDDDDDDDEDEEEGGWRPSRAALAVQEQLAPDDWAMQHGSGAGGVAGAGEVAALWGRLLQLEEEEEEQQEEQAKVEEDEAQLLQSRRRLASARRAALGAVTDCPGNKVLWLRALELLARQRGASGRELQAMVDGARAAIKGDDAAAAAAARPAPSVGCRSRVRVRTDVVSIIAESALA